MVDCARLCWANYCEAIWLCHFFLFFDFLKILFLEGCAGMNTNTTAGYSSNMKRYLQLYEFCLSELSPSPPLPSFVWIDKSPDLYWQKIGL